MYKTEKPVISIIIPAYNEEKTIKKCLSSVLNQNFNFPYKVIVANGPSTDKTREIALLMGVKVIDIKDRGIGIAWQKGSENGVGEILAFTEADTIVPSNWLLDIYRALKDNEKIVGVVGRYELKNKPFVVNLIVKLMMYLSDIIHRVWKGYYAFRGTNFAVKKSVLLKSGGFDPDIKTHGDVELSSRVHNHGKILYLPNLIVKTTDRHLKSPRNFFKFLKRCLVAVYYIDIEGKPKKINKMYDIR